LLFWGEGVGLLHLTEFSEVLFLLPQLKWIYFDHWVGGGWGPIPSRSRDSKFHFSGGLCL
jgi:hypothetical protein